MTMGVENRPLTQTCICMINAKMNGEYAPTYTRIQLLQYNTIMIKFKLPSYALVLNEILYQFHIKVHLKAVEVMIIAIF